MENSENYAKVNISFESFLNIVKQNYEENKILVIPIFKEIVVDTDTPLSIFLKIKTESRFNFLLESVEKRESIGRYSFIGSSKPVYIRGRENILEFYGNGCIRYKTTNDPLESLKDYIDKFKTMNFEDLPPFWGGLIGYVAYNVISMYEPISILKPDNIELPDIYFFLTTEVIVFDNVNRTLKIIVSAKVNSNDIVSTENLKKVYFNAIKNLEKIEKKLCKPLKLDRKLFIPENLEIDLKSWKSNVSKKYFIDIVKKAKEYIKEGDIIQVVLSQRFEKQTSANPIDIYRAMRLINPSPYLFYLDLQDIKLIGSSPEILVSVKGDTILTKPIAGTRPIGKTKEENEKLRKDLLSDEKEKAEHLMLVDLARNDVGKVAEAGTVKVDNFMYVEDYSHVMHIVSDVSGKLKEGYHPIDVLKAVFPVGTVSGAPKVRAMQIIEELEPEKRGVYAGAVGYISFDGNLDTAITIRTAAMRGNNIYVQAGAGIVADSVPEKEYEETINKAKALIKAVEMAEKNIIVEGEG